MRFRTSLIAWLGLWATLTAAAPAAAADSPIRFRPLGESRGLDARVVGSLLFDDQGFLWVGSREGLYRYDGDRALRWSAGETDRDLSDADLRMLHADADGMLWVSTNNGGLNVYDPTSGLVRKFRHRPGDPGSLSNDSVYGVAEAGDGRRWVATQEGLNLLDPRTGRVERFHHAAGDPASLSHDQAFSVLRTRSGDVWITTLGGGVNRWNPASKGFDRHDLAAALQADPGYNQVFQALEASDGTLWFGTRQGLVRMDQGSGRPERVELGVERPEGLYVTGLAEDRRGRIWALLMKDGLVIHDPSTGAAWPVNPASPGTEGQLPAAAYVSLALDGDKVFVGTWGSGVYMGRAGLPTALLVQDEFRAGSGEPGNVTALARLPSGVLLAGAYNGGVGRVAAGERGGDPHVTQRMAAGSAVVSLSGGSDGTVWIGTTETLLRIPPGAATTGDAASAEPIAGLSGPVHVTALEPDGEGGLWVGTGGVGLHRYRPREGRLERHPHRPDDESSPSGDYITAILREEDGRLWIGTRSHGVNLCQAEPLRCRRYGDVRGDAGSLSHFHVTDLFRDREGRIWVSTAAGLHRVEFDDRGEVVGFRLWGRRDGLVSDATTGVLQDDDGSLWISTREGLSRLDPSTGSVFNWLEQDGLPVGTFNISAAARDDAHLYFGSPQGLLAVPSGTPFPAREPSRIALTGIDRLTPDGPVRIEGAAAGPVSVPYGEVISARHAVLDFSETAHEYEYRIGAAKDWIPLGNRPDLTFFDMDPGRHVVHVRGRDVFGQWYEAVPLRIDVVPPFWMTSWFRLLVLVLLAGLMLALHRARTVSLRQRYRALHDLQVERQAALEQAQRSQAGLEEAYAGLRVLTARLESAQEDERKALSRELHDELGQVLVAAKLNLQLAQSAQPGAEVSQRLDETVSMLDRTLGQVRDISRALRPPLLDDAGLVPALQAHLQALARQSGLEIDLHAPSDVICGRQEVCVTVFRLVQESVNNALRHAGAARIVVSLHVEEGMIHLEVRDDGAGFDPKSVVGFSRRGERLGLLGMSERVRALGGDFDIESQPGGGTTVRVRLPA